MEEVDVDEAITTNKRAMNIKEELQASELTEARVGE